MKTTVLTVVLATAFTFSFGQNFKVNNQKSKVQWHAEKVTGEHDGNVNIKSGSLEMANGKLTGGNFVMDMTSITVTDIEDPEWNGKLVGHLKSDDFFSVEKHNTAKLNIVKVIAQGGNKYKVMGKLTIKNITNDVEFMAEVKESNGTVNGMADITIDRTKYDIKYGSGSFFDDLGDKTIYDEFQIKVNLVADKSKA